MAEERSDFWRVKPLEAMNDAEWESLCDGCGRCCLVKLEDEATERIHFTDVGCRLLDGETCRCGDYANRAERVPDCVTLRPENIASLGWMPPTCAYRLLAEGHDLPEWHPLRTGRAESVVEAGVSVSGRLAGSETDFTLSGLIRRIRAWPGRWPRAKSRKAPMPMPKTAPSAAIRNRNPRNKG